ncbi:isoleucine N-monooxygenase 2-like [Momordica charantia]|uniref:Isoleucine N-monooxygenase 2-like n=1 Tax=Momordica charantia TaxID=3673 RepID=A0A6J1DNF2_MOMCH|nr:isoleucine N-monooxygenase 2-like [Momordica charantia]
MSQLADQKCPTSSITKSLSTLFVLMASIVAVMLRMKRKHSAAAAVPEPVPLPPGPKPWPLLGCLPAIAMWSSHTTQPHKWVHAIMKQFDTEIACIRLGSTNIIPVTSPELALEFLKTHDAAFSSRPVPMINNILTCGFRGTIFTPSEDQWKKMKKILVSKILNSSTLRTMSAHIIHEADTLVRYIFTLTATHNNIVNVRSITQHFCGNIIRQMIFNTRYYGGGREDGGPTFEEEEHTQALLTILNHIHAFSISDYMPCLRTLDLDGHQKIVKNALKVIRKYDEPIINERVERWKHGNNKEVVDILDILISLPDENGKSLLSIEEIKTQIMELQVATVDNPSNAVEWAMAELINQPKILKKAVEELDREVGRERLVEEYDIPKLKYLTACVRESFRLHPFSPFNLPHVSNSDIVVAGYLIPKGSEVLLSRSGLGRNPRIWEDPMRFDPERHLKDKTVELGLSEPSLRFITFTRGRRGCIGSSLGTTITMMLFARMLQAFSWSLPPGMTMIDFSESDELSLPKPLYLFAEARLSSTMYQV